MNIDMLSASLAAAWLKISPLVLNLIVALFLLLIGLLVARGLGKLTSFVLQAIQLDKGAKQIGFTTLLEKGNIKKSSSELLGDLVYWLIIFVVVAGVSRIFGLAVEPILTKIFTYMGIVFLASLILGIGLFLASLISGIVQVIMVNIGIEGAKTASRFIYYIVVIFTFLAVLAELGINPEVFLPQMGVVIGAFGLAAAIAFGLGCKDMAADFLHKLFKGK